MTIDEFYDRITDLPKQYENRDLEEYLLALYGLVLKRKEEPMTCDLFFELLENAFTENPVEFDEAWREKQNPPDGNRMFRKFTNPDFAHLMKEERDSTLTPVDYTLQVLQFQIAELNSMRGKQLDHEYKYFGINSDAGHRWYNFDPFGNLECGARCMEDNNDRMDNIDWALLGELLEDGRVYE